LTILNIFALAVALAMDAFAVSMASGVSLKNVSARQFFRLSWHFGLFQAMMPVIGWSAGLSIRTLIENFDHWVAFALLLFVGLNMLRSALGKQDEENTCKDPTRGSSLVLLSVATSIDALAVGLSMALLNVSIWFPAFIIGVVAAFFTALGLFLGSKACQFMILQKYAEGVGAAVLIGIGVNILYEHDVLSFLYTVLHG
jgi:manganese efflux pump family protein